MYTVIAYSALNYSLYIRYNYIYTWRGFFTLFFSFPLLPLLNSPLYPFSTYLAPPAVTGIVLPLLRLLVNWPYLPHPSPIVPPLSNFPEPQLPNAWQRRHWDCSALTMRNRQNVSATKRMRTNRIGPKRITPKHIAPKRIAHKTFLRHKISETKYIGLKTYRRHNVSAT
jgi:hypothetical protein